jgi:hypothetical protein
MLLTHCSSAISVLRRRYSIVLSDANYAQFLVSCSFLIICLLALGSTEVHPFQQLKNPLHHAFDPEAKEWHDLIIGMGSGDG